MSDDEAFTAAIKAYDRLAMAGKIDDGQSWEEAMREAIDVYVDAMTDAEPPRWPIERAPAYEDGWNDAMRHVRGGRA